MAYTIRLTFTLTWEEVYSTDIGVPHVIVFVDNIYRLYNTVYHE